MNSPLVISVNVGAVREVEWNGNTVATGIFKSPVYGPVRVAGTKITGDDQADKNAHGGPDKAVYAFPSEHYESWRSAYPDAEWGWGAFGENLTLAGLLEDTVAVGDRFRCGSAEFIVRQPRQPCFKFAIRIGDKSVVKRMLDTGHTGFYLSVGRDGEFQASDAMMHIDGPEKDRLTIGTFNELIYSKAPDPEALAAASNNPAVMSKWRSWFSDRLKKLESGE